MAKTGYPSGDLPLVPSSVQRIELLLFYLEGEQRFGINVSKVREVAKCPLLTTIPQSHSAIRGIADFRGNAIPMIDLGWAVGLEPVRDQTKAVVIMTEYNLRIQGLLVRQVERIVSTTWDAIHPPPLGASTQSSYLTAVTKIKGDIVEILDVEKVLLEILPRPPDVSPVYRHGPRWDKNGDPLQVMVVDDSVVATTQLVKILQEMGLEVVVAPHGRAALSQLQQWVAAGINVPDKLVMLISDIEMPYMDGYTLTRAIRSDPLLKGLYVVLHTSLSGVFNHDLVTRAGADQFIAKFQPDILASVVEQQVAARAEPAAHPV